MRRKIVFFITMILLVISSCFVFAAEPYENISNDVLNKNVFVGNLLEFCNESDIDVRNLSTSDGVAFKVKNSGWYRLKQSKNGNLLHFTSSNGAVEKGYGKNTKDYYWYLDANTEYYTSYSEYTTSQKSYAYDLTKQPNRGEVTVESLNDDTDIFHWVITDLNLSIGDFLNNLIIRIVGQKITIQKIIFNEIDSLDANFFKKESGGTDVHKVIKKAVTDWYSIFEAIAITFYMTGLLGIGIKMVISDSAFSKSSAKDVAVKWLTGILILFLFNNVMKYAFEINEGLVGAMKNEFAPHGKETGTYIGEAGEYDLTAFEFRSPNYRSKYTGVLAFGGQELNESYLKRLDDYRSSADMMRVMRAYAGISHRIIFCIIWFVLLFQMIVLLVKYYKRYFVIALLITIFPFVTIIYLIDAIKGKQCEVFRVWCVEFFVNVFTQTVHAIIYSIIASICIERVVTEMMSSQTMNWIIIICAINFLFQGEKIVRKLLGVDGASSMRSIEESAQAGRAGAGRARGYALRLGKMMRHGGGK